MVELIKTDKIFDSHDLLFFGEKIQAWGKSKKHTLEELVNNYIDPNKYPLKGQAEYQIKYDTVFAEFCEKY